MKNKERFAAYFEGEDAVLSERYENLYGSRRGTEWLAGQRKARKKRLLILAASFLLLFVYAAVSLFLPTKGLLLEDGRWVGIERPAKEEPPLTIDAKLYAVKGEEVVESQRPLIIYPAGETADRTDRSLGTETEEEALTRRLEQTLRQVAADSGEQVVYLPSRLEDGTPLVWKEERRPLFLLVFLLFAMAALYLYHSRFAAVEKLEREARASVIRELPVFLNRLLLLLGAGVVLDTAFRRAMEPMTEDTYFGGQMKELSRQAEESLTPLTTAFREFALRSGVMELARLANILYDNVGHGNDLAEKLKGESALLWFQRKKQTEEQGRLAETKMTLPLAILLFVLLLITVAPALLEMG